MKQSDVRERPILMSAPMVRALLAGRKFQTRRTAGLGDVNREPDRWRLATVGPLDYMAKPSAKGKVGATFDNVKAMGDKRVELLPSKECDGSIRVCPQVCPYGGPGTKLWVRETWQCFDAGRGGKLLPPNPRPGVCAIGYLASEPERVAEYGHPYTGPWRPSIFLPRWASRFLLEVVSVEPQRLHDITEVDAKAEGIEADDCPYPETTIDVATGAVPPIPRPSLRAGFAMGWDRINRKRSPWARNDWVWAITFSVLEGPTS